MITPRRPSLDEPDVFDAAFWDARYASAPVIWSGRPNPQLVAEVADLTPTTALDVGCGEGADAVWLAARGWQVTALDISQVALDRAAAHARAAGAEVAGADHLAAGRPHRGRRADRDVRAGLRSVHATARQPQRDTLYRALAALVADGGTLLVVGHHPSDLETAPDLRPHHPELMFTADDIVALLEPRRVADRHRRGPLRVRSPTVTARDVKVKDAVLVARRTTTPEPS